MKNAIAFLLFLTSIPLIGQEVIEPGEVKMGTFTTGETECYEFSVEVAGDYKLSYNLWDATLVVKDPTGQVLFTDYLAIFEETWKEQVLNFREKGTYQFCFTKNGTVSSMYQIKVEKHSTVANEQIHLKYGDYHLKENVMDLSKITYTFDGKQLDEIYIGISGGLTASVKVRAPSGNELFNQSYELPPQDGVNLQLELEETGLYSIEITPLFTSLQYTLSLYLIDPIDAEVVILNEKNGGLIVNSGVVYHSFYAYPNDSLKFTFRGYTPAVTIDILFPDGSIMNCSDVLDEMHVEQSFYVEQEGEYLIIIKSSLQGYLSYEFNVTQAEDYVLGTIIIRDMVSLYGKTYTFKASASDILRVGLNLPYGLLELSDPDGDVIMEIDSTYHRSITAKHFKEINLRKTGYYFLTVWHKSPVKSVQSMEFCASLVPESIAIVKDSLYKVTVPPFHRIPMHFETVSGEVFRSGFSDGFVLARQYYDTLELRYGCTYIENRDRINEISLSNTSTMDDQHVFSIMSVVPPKQIIEINIGDSSITRMINFDSPSFEFSGMKDDTLFIQAEIKETVTSPDENNIIPSQVWLFISNPSGETLKVSGNAFGEMTDNGYTITYKISKGYITRENGTYFLTFALDREITGKEALCSVSIGTGIAEQIVPFGIETPYSLSGDYLCSVPENIDKLFVIVKKNSHIWYDDTWPGLATLHHQQETWESTVGTKPRQDDFIFYINNPQTGDYTIPLISEQFNIETRGYVLFTDQLPELGLNEWTSGIITRPYGSDFKMLKLEQSADTLFIEGEGFGLWSRIEVYSNEFELITSINNWGAGYHIKGFVVDLQAGTYYVRYVDSAVLYDSSDDHYKTYKADQTRTYLLYAGTSGQSETERLSVRDVSTKKVGAYNASITLYGSGFSVNNQICLMSVKDQSIINLDIREIDYKGTQMRVASDFSQSAPGLYRLRVNNDVDSVFYSSYIEILPELIPSIKTTLLTSNLYRTGRFQKCIIRVKNNGNVDIPYIAGMFYTSNEQVHIYHTEMYESFANPDTINSYLVNNPQHKLFLYIENLGVGNTVEFVYKIYSENLTQNETFNVGVKMGILEESDYYSLQNEMAEKYYNYVLTFENLPDSTRTFLEDIKLDGFIDIWNGKNELELRSVTINTNSNSGRQKASDGTTRWGYANTAIPIVVEGPTAITGPYSTAIIGPFFIPQKIVEGIVKGITEVGEDICDRLDELLDKVKELLKSNVTFEKQAVTSSTPEDKYGPIGYGMEHGNGYIPNLDEFEYRIDYWNKEDATAPAAIVYIRDTIDTDFDLTTLNFTELGFLKWKVKLDGGQYFDVNVDCRPDMPYIVNVKGTVDHYTREAYWVHTTLDPTTMDTPDDPLSGYLPPIDSTGYQLGWVNYSLRPVDDLEHNATFENQAFVNFDGVGKWGPAPPYGPYTNILDLNPPFSYVKALNPVQTDVSFDIYVRSMDEESGIDFTNIYVSKNDGKAVLWKTTKDSILTFTGENGALYRFFSRATDKVGNTEIKLNFEASTFIQLIETYNYPHFMKYGNEMHIIPNPNRGVFRIETNITDEKGMIEVISLSGQTMHIEEYTTGRNFDLGDVPKGIYILRFYNKKRLLNGKLSLIE